MTKRQITQRRNELDKLSLKELVELAPEVPMSAPVNQITGTSIVVAKTVLKLHILNREIGN